MPRYLLEQSQCDEAWKHYYGKLELSRKSPTQTITSLRTDIYETIERFGPNSTYTLCDGIPRLRFTSPITSSASRMVTAISMHRRFLYPEPQVPDCAGLLPSQSTHTFLETICDSKTLEIFAQVAAEETAEASRVPVQTLTPQSCLMRKSCSFQYSEEVLVLYWPPRLEARDICALNDTDWKTLEPTPGRQTITTIDAITFVGKDLYRRGWIWNGTTLSSHTHGNFYVEPYTLSGPFTLTWPSVYVAHRPLTLDIDTEIYVQVTNTALNTSLYFDSIYLSGKTSTGGILTEGLFALNSDQVFSSIAPHPLDATVSGVEYAQHVAQGRFHYGAREDYSKAFPLNFGHLVDPVPAGVYFDARQNDCWGKQSHCGTITDGSHRPILSLHSDIWKRFKPDGLDCFLPDLVDPPIALHPIVEDYPRIPSVSSLATQRPTITKFSNFPMRSDSQAKPGNTVGPDRPLKTSGPSGQRTEPGTPWWKYTIDKKGPGPDLPVFEGSSTSVKPSFRTSYWAYCSVLVFVLI